MGKFNTTITKKDGTTASGYIENGRSYYSNGTSISGGDSVTDASGRVWTKPETSNTNTTGNTSNQSTVKNTTVNPDAGLSMNQYLSKYGVKSSGSSSTDYITRSAELKKVAANADYEKAYNTILAQLAAEREKTKAAYTSAKNSTATNDEINEKNFFENTANRGQTYSGATSQGELALKIAKMNNQSNLNVAESQALGNISRSESQANSDYAYNVAESNANIDAQKYDNLLAQYRLDEEKASQEKKEKFEREIATINQYYSDYSAEIQRREAINPNDPLLPYLKTAKQEKIQKLTNELKEEEKKSNQEKIERAYNTFTQLGYVPNKEIGDLLGLPVGMATNAYRNTTSLINDRAESSTSNGSGKTDSYSKKAENNGKAINSLYKNVLIGYGNGVFSINPSIPKGDYLDLIIARTFDNKGMNDDEKAQFLSSLGISMEDITRVADYYVK